MKIRQTITPNGEIHFTENQTAYLQKNAGKRVIVQIDERTTSNKIAFFEVIVKYFFFQHNIGAFINFADARYSLKVIADHTEFRINPRGKSEMVVRSMAEIYESNPKTIAFIDKLQDHFLKNGYLFPDSEHWKNWDGTLTSENKDEVYPPLATLIAEYKSQTKEDTPSWRK